MKLTATLASAKTPSSNLIIHERKVVTSLSRDLKITIMPADKGRCTVLLNTEDHPFKVTSLLSDTVTYEALRRDPTSSHSKKITDYLQQLKKDEVIDQILYYHLYPSEATPLIYGLPKIHKKGAPLRPIVSRINSVSYNSQLPRLAA